MIEIVRQHVMPAAFALLPEPMRAPEAAALLLAIGWQESRFEARRQMPTGPARGFWQFEQRGATRGVVGHERTRDHVREMWAALGYRDALTPFALQDALTHNDILACGCARLLLWTLPGPLPRADQPEDGWRQYLAAWRPGKPHPETWRQAWAIAWTTA